MLTMLALVTVLQASEPPPLQSAQPAPGEGVSLDSQRVRRFVGALLGGAVGLAIPLAVERAELRGDAVMQHRVQNFTLGILPLVGGLGAYFGHHLMGGEAEYPFAAIAAAGGSLLGAIALMFAQSIGVPPTALLPYAASAAGLTTFLMALMLDTRDQAIADVPPEGHATGARLWATFGVAVGLGIAGAFTSTILGLISPYIGIASGLAALGLVPMLAWTVHGALGGKGSFGSAYVGLLVSIGALLAVTLPTALLNTTRFSTNTAFYASQQSALLTGSAFLTLLLGPIIGLELSHSSAVRESGVQPSFSLAPVPGGAMVGAGITF